MNLHIKTETVGHNNKILISDSKFSLGKNDKVNSEGTEKLSHGGSVGGCKVVTQTTATQVQKPTITHEEEKITLILSLTGTFTIWYMFR